MQIIIIFSLYWCIYLYIYTFYCYDQYIVSQHNYFLTLGTFVRQVVTHSFSRKNVVWQSQYVTIYKTGANQRLPHINSIKERVNVTSENYNKKLFFSSRCYSNDITQWFKFKIQATSKTERENDKLVIRSFPLKFGGEKNWEQDY